MLFTYIIIHNNQKTNKKMRKTIILIAFMLAISSTLTINHLRGGQNKGKQGQNNKEKNHPPCAQNQFFNRQSRTCQSCTTIQNSDGTSIRKGCNCVQDYFWNHQDQTCIQCPAEGCPLPHQKNEREEDGQTQTENNGKSSHKMKKNKCTDTQFYDRSSNSCESCSTVQNSDGTSGLRGDCSCNENYFWNYKEQSCTQCPAEGCPEPHEGKGFRKNGREQNESQSSEN